MNLLTVPQFVELSGVSKQAIYNHLRKGEKLRYSNGSKKIDLDDPLTRAYLDNPSSQRQSNILNDPEAALEIIDPSGQTALSTRKKNELANKYGDAADEKARVDRARAEQLEMKNAVMRAELYKADLVEQYLFLYLDRLHSNLDRLSGSTLADVVRQAIIDGELKPDGRLKWKDACKNAVHEAKIEIVERLENIKEEQAKG